MWEGGGGGGRVVNSSKGGLKNGDPPTNWSPKNCDPPPPPLNGHKKLTHGAFYVEEAVVCSSLYFVSRLLFVSYVNAIGYCSTRALLLKSTLV